MLDEFKDNILPLAKELPFYERIPALDPACEVCDWTQDLNEIEYNDENPDQDYYYPSPKHKIIRCAIHAGQLIKRLEAEGVEYTVRAIADTDPYPVYYEVMDDRGMDDEMLDHDYYDENGNPL